MGLFINSSSAEWRGHGTCIIEFILQFKCRLSSISVQLITPNAVVVVVPCTEIVRQLPGNEGRLCQRMESSERGANAVVWYAFPINQTRNINYGHLIGPVNASRVLELIQSISRYWTPFTRIRSPGVPDDTFIYGLRSIISLFSCVTLTQTPIVTKHEFGIWYCSVMASCILCYGSMSAINFPCPILLNGNRNTYKRITYLNIHCHDSVVLFNTTIACG